MMYAPPSQQMSYAHQQQPGAFTAPFMQHPTASQSSPRRPATSHQTSTQSLAATYPQRNSAQRHAARTQSLDVQPSPLLPNMFVEPTDLSNQALSARLQENMLANAQRSGRAAHALNAPLSPQVHQQMQQLSFGHPSTIPQMLQYQQQPPSSANPYLSPRHPVSPGKPSKPQAYSHLIQSSPGQLHLPAEFLHQQQAKFLAEQQKQIQATLAAKIEEKEEKKDSRPSTAALVQQLLAVQTQVPLSLSPRSFMQPPPSAPQQAQMHLKSPRHRHSHSSPSRHHEKKYVPVRIGDVAYANMKKRSEGLLQHLKKSAADQSKERSAAVQLEMRGSVRFNMSNPSAIFAAVEAQVAAPVTDTNYNEKHQVKLKDGTSVWVFGRILERPDAVREQSISQFFVQKERGDMPTLDRFVTENFKKDLTKLPIGATKAELAKHDARNKGNERFERKARVERTDEELLSCGDEVLTPLERWKRDQLALKLHKEKAAEESTRAHKVKQAELLKLRLEKERFEREDREKYEAEKAIRDAKEAEERAQKDAEKQRQYRELVLLQAEEQKTLRREEEERKRREEEREKKVQEEKRKKLAGALDLPSFMKPLSTKIQRTPEEEIVIARVKDAEKDYQIARAKLRAEVMRVEELMRKRERANKGRSEAADPAEAVSIATIKDPSDFTTALKRLVRTSGLTPDEHKLKELEAKEQEARYWWEKRLQEQDAMERKIEERERENSQPISRAITNLKKIQAQSTISTSSSSATLNASASNRSVRPDREGHTPVEEDDEAAGGGGAGGGGSRFTSPLGLSSRALRQQLPGSPTPAGTRTPPNGAKTPKRGRSRATSRAASRAASPVHSRTPSPVAGGSHSPILLDTVSPARRASGHHMVHQSSMDSLGDLDRRSSARSTMGPGTNIPSGVVSPNGERTDGSEYGGSTGVDGEETPIVNERTLAIDEARAKMLSAQADFEARIKALTSFSPSSPPTTRKKTTKRGTVKPKAGAMEAAVKAGASKKKLVMSGGSTPAEDKSPNTAKSADDEDAKLAAELQKAMAQQS